MHLAAQPQVCGTVAKAPVVVIPAALVEDALTNRRQLVDVAANRLGGLKVEGGIGDRQHLSRRQKCGVNGGVEGAVHPQPVVQNRAGPLTLQVEIAVVDHVHHGGLVGRRGHRHQKLARIGQLIVGLQLTGTRKAHLAIRRRSRQAHRPVGAVGQRPDLAIKPRRTAMQVIFAFVAVQADPIIADPEPARRDAVPVTPAGGPEIVVMRQVPVQRVKAEDDIVPRACPVRHEQMRQPGTIGDDRGTKPMAVGDVDSVDSGAADLAEDLRILHQYPVVAGVMCRAVDRQAGWNASDAAANHLSGSHLRLGLHKQRRGALADKMMFLELGGLIFASDDKDGRTRNGTRRPQDTLGKQRRLAAEPVQ